MRTATLRPGDLVEVDVRGRIFPARVEDTADQAIPGCPIRVEPLAASITYRHLNCRHIRKLISRGVS